MGSYLNQFMHTFSEEELRCILAFVELEATAELIAEEIIKYSGVAVNDSMLANLIIAIQDDFRNKFAEAVESKDAFSLTEWISFWFGNIESDETKKPEKGKEEPVQKKTTSLSDTGIFFKESSELLSQLEEATKKVLESKVEKTDESSKERKSDVEAFDAAIEKGDREGIQKFIDKYVPHWGLQKQEAGYDINEKGEQVPKYTYTIATKRDPEASGVEQQGKDKTKARVIDKYDIGEYLNYSTLTQEAITAANADNVESAREAINIILSRTQDKIDALTKQIYGSGTFKLITDWASDQTGPELREKYVNPNQFEGAPEKSLKDERTKTEKNVELAKQVLNIKQKKDPYTPDSDYFDAGKSDKLQDTPGKAKPTTGRLTAAVASLETLVGDSEMMLATYLNAHGSKANESEKYQEMLDAYKKEYATLETENAAIYSKLTPITNRINELTAYLQKQDATVVAVAEKIISGEALAEAEQTSVSGDVLAQVQPFVKELLDLRNTLNKDMYDVTYTTNIRRMKNIKGAIDDVWQYLKDDEHWAAVKSYSEKIPRFTRLLESAKEKLKEYTTIVDAVPVDRLGSLDKKDLKKILDNLNDIFYASEEQKLKVPGDVTTEGEVATAVPGDDETKNVLDDTAIVQLRNELINGLNNYNDEQSNMQEQYKNLYKFMEGTVTGIKNSYNDCQKAVKDSLMLLKKESSKRIEKPVALDKVEKKFISLQQELSKFREDLDNDKKPHTNNPKIKEAVLYSANMKKVLGDYIISVSEDDTMKGILENNGITLESLKGALEDILNFGRHTEDNFYGIDNINSLAEALSELPKEDAVVAKVPTDLAKVLKKCGSAIKKISEKSVNDTITGAKSFKDSINAVLQENVLDTAKLMNLFEDARKSEILSGLFGDASVKDFQSSVQLSTAAQDSAVTDAITGNLLESIKKLSSSLSTAIKDSKIKGDELVAAVLGKDRSDLLSLSERLGSVTTELSNTSLSKEEKAALTKEQKDIRTKIKEGQDDTRTKNFADTVLFPQKKQSIVYLGDLRNPLYNDYLESRTSKDVLQGMLTTRDVTMSPSAVEARDRNWYSTVSVWRTLARQCASSVTHVVASNTNEYAAEPGEPSPHYKEYGSSPLRNELDFVNDNINNLEYRYTNDPKANKLDILKEIEQQKDYSKTITDILSKVSKDPRKFVIQLRGSLEQEISSNNLKIKNIKKQTDEPWSNPEIQKLQDANYTNQKTLREVGYLITKLTNNRALTRSEKKLIKEFLITPEENKLINQLKLDWKERGIGGEAKQLNAYKKTLSNKIYELKDIIDSPTRTGKPLDQKEKAPVLQYIQHLNYYIFRLQYDPELKETDLAQIKEEVAALEKEASSEFSKEVSQKYRPSVYTEQTKSTGDNDIKLVEKSKKVMQPLLQALSDPNNTLLKKNLTNAQLAELNKSLNLELVNDWFDKADSLSEQRKTIENTNNQLRTYTMKSKEIDDLQATLRQLESTKKEKGLTAGGEKSLANLTATLDTKLKDPTYIAAKQFRDDFVSKNKTTDFTTTPMDLLQAIEAIPADAIEDSAIRTNLTNLQKEISRLYTKSKSFVSGDPGKLRKEQQKKTEEYLKGKSK